MAASNQPAGSPTERPDPVSGSLRPIRPEEFGYDQARHLLWRAGFGGTPLQVQTLVSWGPTKAVDSLLNVADVPYENGRASEFDNDIMHPPSPAERQAIAQARRAQDENALAKLRLEREKRERRDRSQIRDVQKWWLERMIETPRPLEEKMVLFWHGHFATSYRTIENSYHMFLQNELFRRHALGSFGDLLRAIIRDPAMLAYLDNNDSRKGRPNENLARELMELFSLGVGNYDERDIKDGARALTGYTFYDDAFQFVRNNHDTGAKNILGHSGQLDGDEFVAAILSQSACPQFIARKLYRYFVADAPDSDRDTDPGTRAVLARISGSLRASNYELKPVLRTLFLSRHFYEPAVMGQQIKSPVQLVVGAVRSLNTPVRDLSLLLDALDLMGQHVLFPPSVKGWDGGRSWINTSTLFVRQNILAFLLTGKKPRGYDAMADAEKYDPAPLLAELAGAEPGADKDAARVIDYLLKFNLGRAPADARAALTNFMSTLGGSVTPDAVTGMLVLITAMPEYQLC
ncbi:MAG: DUF1800 family protein [Phycisphaerales bacterium]